MSEAITESTATETSTEESVINPLDHLHLVKFIMKKINWRGCSRDEIYAMGCLGLTKACRSFKPSKGFQFSTYASRAIRLTIIREIYELQGVAHVPEHLHRLLWRGDKREGLRPKQIEARDAAKLVLKSGKRTMIDDNLQSIDCIVDPLSCEPEKSDLAEIARNLLATLPEAEQRVVALFYGIDSETGPVIREDIAKEFGVSIRTIDAIKARALNRMRLQLAS